MKYITLLCLGLFCSSTFAAWTLQNDMSSLHFVSTKKEHISEVHQFTQLAGNVDESGMLTVKIDLSSVETGIDIRNQRMREKLFMVDKFPAATLTSSLPENLLKLKAGESVNALVKGELSLFGHSKSLDLSIMVSKLNDQTLIASSTKPVLINAADFKLDAGIKLLQEIAGLPSIGLMVPVNFNVTFTAQD